MKMKKCLRNDYGNFEERKFKSFVEGLNKDLPQNYIEYLKTYNGGKVSPDCFDINEQEGATKVSAFYGLHDGPEFNRLDSVNEVFRNRIPGDCIAIACDTTGNQICIGLGEKNNGEIYFWDHELESSDEGFIKISSSLDGFFDRLYEFNLNNDETSRILISKDENEWEKFISTYDIEAKDENGRSLIERAVIKNNLIGVKVLVDSGARLNNSLELAKKNRKFFPAFENMCIFLESLTDL